MVADGVERCPACGARMQPRVLDAQTGFTWSDLFHYSLVAILFGLVAIVVPVLLVVGCVLLYWG